METYVLTLSQTFPVKHPKAGQPTGFAEKVQEALNYVEYFGTIGMLPTKCAKIHTMRDNWELWSKRFDKIYAGKACISLRIWSGKPYHSKQIEIARLTKDDGIGLQPVYITELYHIGLPDMDVFMRVAGGYGWREEDPMIDGRIMAANDGLTLQDWVPFFRKHDLSKPLALIHFTSYRYN